LTTAFQAFFARFSDFICPDASTRLEVEEVEDVLVLRDLDVSKEGRVVVEG